MATPDVTASIVELIGDTPLIRLRRIEQAFDGADFVDDACGSCVVKGRAEHLLGLERNHVHARRCAVGVGVEKAGLFGGVGHGVGVGVVHREGFFAEDGFVGGQQGQRLLA